MLDLTNVDADSAYHNWLERQKFSHSPEIEHAFMAGWNILSNFIEGPEQSEVDWAVVCEAVSDATMNDEGSPGPKSLEHYFGKCGLLVVHRSIDARPLQRRNEMSVLYIEDREVEDFLLYAEKDRWLRIKKDLEVLANTLRNSPGKMATKEGEELLDSLSDEIDTRLSEVISRLKTIERAE